MSDKTGIAWTDATWNPIRGCSRVSEGCRNCYAESVAARFSGAGLPYEGLTRDGKWTGEVRVIERHFLDPLRWSRPRRIFVNSMSDLFHANVTDETIDRVFAVMALAPRHTFQVLTKRPERMRAYLRHRHTNERTARASVLFVPNAALTAKGIEPDLQQDAMAGWAKWPLSNVWLGVSVEDQATADARVPLLLQTPAAVRFISYEPALGPVRFDRLTVRDEMEMDCLRGSAWATVQHAALPPWAAGQHIDQIIVGGESGPGARPCDVAWIRSTRDQCKAAGVACFVKQLGAKSCDGEEPDHDPNGADEPRWLRLNDRAGADPAEWPEDLRVREFPAGVAA